MFLKCLGARHTASSKHWDEMDRFDVFPKISNDLKVRTLSGALLSIVVSVVAVMLFTSEFRHWRALETVDHLDVDTHPDATRKLWINLDLYFPSLPCGELVTEVTDESGTQQLAVTDTLHKLRMDRNGVPIDIPQRVDWGHDIAPAFQQRKVGPLAGESRGTRRHPHLPARTPVLSGH